MAAIIDALIGPLGAVAAVVAAIVAAWARGRQSGAEKAEKHGYETELRAHERINDADIGGGATDAERINRLRNIGRGQWGD